MTDPVAQLDLRYESCVRAVSVVAGCRACVDACPTDAVGLGEVDPSAGSRATVEVALAACTGCGRCAAACPTDAFTPPFDLQAFLLSASGTLRCGEQGLPCVEALAAEDWLVLVARLGDVAVEAADGCGHGGHDALAGRLAEVRAFLAAAGLPGGVTWQRSGAGPALDVGGARAKNPAESAEKGAAEDAAEAAASPRRRFFSALRAKLPTDALAAAEPAVLRQPARLDVRALQRQPPRRARLLTALGRAAAPALAAAAARAPVVPGGLGFTSSKQLDTTTCTVCTLCVRLCPTGALQADRRFRWLDLDARACVRCGLCHDVCDPESLTLDPDLRLGAFLAGEVVRLGELRARSCGECGMRYNIASAANDRGLCPRCFDLEAEAVALSRSRSR